jgi:hypothetical protein
MVQTIVAVDPITHYKGLLVEVYPESLPDGEIQKATVELERRLFDWNIRVGIVVTPDVMLVVRDLVIDRGFSANRFEVQKVPTGKLLEHAGLGRPHPGASLASQMRQWLEAVGRSWFSFLWPEAVSAMVPDVVGHLVRVDLEEFEGLLGQNDAA